MVLKLFLPVTMYDLANPLLDDPLPLQEACIDYICDNISSLCNSVTTNTGEQYFRLRKTLKKFYLS